MKESEEKAVAQTATNHSNQVPKFVHVQNQYAEKHAAYENKIAKRKAIITVVTTAFGFAGNFIGSFLINKKLLNFEHQVNELTRQDILEAKNQNNADVTRGGVGFGGNHLEDYHETNLIKTGKHKLAEYTRYLGGKGSVALIAAGIGAAVGVLVSRLIVGKRPTPPEPPKPEFIHPARASVSSHTEEKCNSKIQQKDESPQKEWKEEVRKEETVNEVEMAR